MITTTLLLTVAASAPIEKVVVFADRAEVTRRTRVACAQGAATARFELLPDTMDVRTLRGHTVKIGKAVGVSSRQVPHDESVDARTAALDKELAAIDRELEGLNDQKRVRDTERKAIDGYGQVFAKVLTESMRNPRPPHASWAKTLEQFKARRKSLGKAQIDLQVALRKAKARRNLVRRKLAHLQRGRSKTSRSADVSVDCGRAKSVDVRLSYVVPGARWTPEYDLDFRPRGKRDVGPGQATLTVSAVVAQSTGEDWADVELHLSTAKPKLGASAPYPAPLYVDGQAQKRTKVLVQAHEKRAKLRSGSAAQGGAPQAAALEDKGQSFVLRIPRKVTVVSDGRP